MILRRPSKAIQIGSVTVGGGALIVVQSMTNTDTRDAAATARQILELEECGCETIRVAVPDMDAAQALPAIKRAIRIPLIADIHFDYRLALASLQGGVDGLRLNPGNIRDPKRISAVVRAAKERGVPIRIGVNAGSLPPALIPPSPPSRDDHGVSTYGVGTSGEPLSTSERMVEVALSQIRLLESLDFDLIKVSLKAFDVPTAIEAYKSIAWKTPYPLHLGITEAGTPRAGSVRSAVGIGTLLYMGIGDTIRVSLTGDPCEEVVAAYEILKSLNLREKGPTMISCPSCGRAEVDIIGLAQAVEKRLEGMEKPIKVAVMGCVVNGPGEAREADVGIACGKGKGIIFRKGQIVGTVEERDFLSAILAEVERVQN